MKSTKIAKVLILISVIAYVIYSCKKDEGFHQISAIEQQIHQKINDYRVSDDLNALVFQPLLFKEARSHSMRMANKKEINNEGLDAVFDDLISKIGGTNAGYILDVSQFAVADSIVNGIIAEAETNDVALGTFTQAGVGVAADADKIYYITILFLNIPKK